MSSDQWEALFGLWHEKAHNSPELLRDLLELERRIVKLEAYMKAAKLDSYERARAGMNR